MPFCEIVLDLVENDNFIGTYLPTYLRMKWNLQSYKCHFKKKKKPTK